MTSLSKSTAEPVADSDVEQAIVRLAHENPLLGQAAAAERLQQAGLKISASGVRYIWKKHGLETAVKRLQALTAHHEEGLDALNDNERRLLERGLVTHQLSLGATTELGDEAPLERRQIILNAAAELFSDQGYNRTSMREIASKVGLLPGSVYHYFSSKEELFMAVHKEGFRAVMDKVKEAIAAETDPWESLRRACEVHVNQMFSGTPVDRLTGHSLAFTHDDELLAMIQTERDAYEQVFKDLIAALPLASHVDRSLLRLTLLGAMNWVFIWYREGKRSTIEIADTIVQMLRHGVQQV